MPTSVIASRTRTDEDDDDGGNAIDAGRRSRDRECHSVNDAMSMRDTREGEQREREEKREEERRAMWRRRQRGCDDGIDKPRERGDDAEPQNRRDEGDVTMTSQEN